MKTSVIVQKFELLHCSSLTDQCKQIDLQHDIFLKISLDVPFSNAISLSMSKATKSCSTDIHIDSLSLSFINKFQAGPVEPICP